MALVEILNRKSSKNKRVMTLIRHLVLLTMNHNILIKAKHVVGKVNTICDAISRFQWTKLAQVLPPSAMKEPCKVPTCFLNLFVEK